MLNPADLQKYTAMQVANLVDVDVYACRDEGERRQNGAEKKIARLLKQIKAAREELKDGVIILEAVHHEMGR